MKNYLDYKTEFNPTKLYNSGKNEKVIMGLKVYPNEEIRNRLSSIANRNSRMDLCIIIDADESKVIQNLAKNNTKFNVAIESIKRLVSYRESRRGSSTLLDSEDTVSIVINYEDGIKILDKCKVKNKDKIKEKISLQTSYNCNGDLSKALRVARDILSTGENCIKKILLLSDALQESEYNDSEIKSVANKLTKENIFIDCIPITKEANHQVLQKISVMGSGRSISKNICENKAIYDEYVKKNKEIIICAAKIKMSFANGVRLTDYYRSVPDMAYLGKYEFNSKNELILQIGNLEINQLYQYYFEMTIDTENNNRKDSYAVAQVSLEYRVPSVEKELIRNDTTLEGFEIVTNIKAEEFDSAIKREYDIVTIKRLEDEAALAKVENKMEVWINLYSRIYEIYKVHGMIEEQLAIENLISDYKDKGIISELDLQNTVSTSTRPINSGILKQTSRYD